MVRVRASQLVQLGGALSEGEAFQLCAMLTAPRLAAVLLLNFLQADRFALLFHSKMRATLACALFEFGTWSALGGAGIEQIPVAVHAEAEMCGTSSGKLIAQLCGGAHAVLQPFLTISKKLCELAVDTRFGSSASAVLLFVVRACVQLHGFLLRTRCATDAPTQAASSGNHGSPSYWLQQLRGFMRSPLRPMLLKWLQQTTHRRSVRDMLMLHSHVLLLESQLSSAKVSESENLSSGPDYVARMLASASFLHAFQCEASTASDAAQQEAAANESSQLGWREQLALEKEQQEKLEQRRAENAIESEALEAVQWALEAWHEAVPRVLSWFQTSSETQQAEVLELAAQCVLLQGIGAVADGSDGKRAQLQQSTVWERQGTASSLQFVDAHRGIVLQVWSALLIQLDSSGMQLVPQEVVRNSSFQRLFHSTTQGEASDDAELNPAEANNEAHWCTSVTIRSDSLADEVPMWQFFCQDAMYYIVKHDQIAPEAIIESPLPGFTPETFAFHGTEWQPADKTSDAVAYLRALLRIECGGPSVEWDLYAQVPSVALQQAKHAEFLVRKGGSTRDESDESFSGTVTWLTARVWLRGNGDGNSGSIPVGVQQPYIELWELQAYMGATHPHLVYTSDISQSWASLASKQLPLSAQHWVRSPLCLRKAHGDLRATATAGVHRRQNPELLLWRVPRQAGARQHLLTHELLLGILPQLLVDQFDFWTSTEAEESTPPVTKIIGYSRSLQWFDYTLHVTLSPTAPAMVTRELKQGSSTVQQHLFNPQLMSAASPPYTVWQLMTALEDNSHCLLWGTVSEHGELSIAVAELPRLRLRFTLEQRGPAAAQQQGSNPALYCAECGGLSVSYRGSEDERLQRLRRSFPRSLLLSDSQHRLFLLLPDHTPHLVSRPAEAHGAMSQSLAMDLALEADEARWAKQGGSTRYFVLQVDLLCTCLVAPTRAAAMYCSLLQLLSGEYAQAMRSLDACATNTQMMPYERWVLSMVAQSTKDLHPNAIACRLRLASVALDLNDFRGGSAAEDHDVLFHVPWELKADVVAYVQRLPLVSGHLRLRADLCPISAREASLRWRACCPRSQQRS